MSRTAAPPQTTPSPCRGSGAAAADDTCPACFAPAPKTPAFQLPLVDALKAVACLLIVAHHLAFYGPMSDAAHPLAPTLLDWLSDTARFAVQAFLVIGGFLAARPWATAPAVRCERPWLRIAQRYRRLVVPYAAALLLCMVVAAYVRPWLPGTVVPSPPDPLRILAHLLLVHDLIGQEALSAGVWYVAIDFQLFALMIGLAALVERLPESLRTTRTLAGVVAVPTVLSLAVFNRLPVWDSSALYFFGAYGMGSLACWTSGAVRPWRATALLVLLGGAALLLDYRGRIAVALATALLLAAAMQSALLRSWEPPRALRYLGRVSFSVFLVHFPVCLLVAAVVHGAWPDDSGANAWGMVVALVLSVGAGALFHEGLERVVGHWGRLRGALRLPGGRPDAVPR